MIERTIWAVWIVLFAISIGWTIRSIRRAVRSRKERATPEPSIAEQWQMALDAARAEGDIPGQVEPLLQLGWMRQRDGDATAALSLHQQALRLANDSGPALLIARALAELANLQVAQGDHELGLATAGQARETLARITGEPYAAHLWNRLVDAYSRLDRHDEVFACVERAEAIAREHNRSVELALALGNKASALRATGYPEEAISAMEEAADLSLSHRFDRHRGWILASLAELYDETGEREKRVGALSRLLVHGQETGDTRVELYASEGLGNLLGEMGDPAAGERHLNVALAIAQKQGDGEALARAHTNLGISLARRDQQSGAGRHLLRALQYYREVGNEDEEARIEQMLEDIGVMAPITDPDAARASLAVIEAALADLDEDAVGEQIELLGKLGLTHGMLGEYDQAVEVFRQVRELARAHGDRLNEANALYNAGAALLEAGETLRARNTLNQAAKLYEALGKDGLADDTRRLIERL